MESNALLRRRTDAPEVAGKGKPDDSDAGLASALDLEPLLAEAERHFFMSN